VSFIVVVVTVVLFKVVWLAGHTHALGRTNVLSLSIVAHCRDRTFYR